MISHWWSFYTKEYFSIYLSLLTMLGILLTLHIYWAIFIYNIGIDYLKKKQLTSVYDLSVNPNINEEKSKVKEMN